MEGCSWVGWPCVPTLGGGWGSGISRSLWWAREGAERAKHGHRGGISHVALNLNISVPAPQVASKVGELAGGAVAKLAPGGAWQMLPTPHRGTSPGAQQVRGRRGGGEHCQGVCLAALMPNPRNMAFETWAGGVEDASDAPMSSVYANEPNWIGFSI